MFGLFLRITDGLLGIPHTSSKRVASGKPSRDEMIISRTPYRVSFFGGGTDYPAWHRKHGGAVLVSTIDKYCYVSFRALPPFFDHISRAVWSKVELVNDNYQIENPAIRGMFGYLAKQFEGYEIHHQGDLPARSGMGSSSSFIVGLLNAHWAATCEPDGVHDQSVLGALQRGHDHAMSLAKTAIRIEREFVGDTVGFQDQYAAALGGVRYLIAGKGDRDCVAALGCYRGRVDQIEDKLMLVYLGMTRHASEIAKAQIAEIDYHKTAMFRMMEQAEHGYHILTGQRPVSDFPLLLKEAWEIKRKLSPLITNKEIDHIHDGLVANGARAAKLIGAGNGGFFLVYVEPKDREDLIAWTKFQSANPRLLAVPFKFSHRGSEIIFREDGLGYGGENLTWKKAG